VFFQDLRLAFMDCNASEWNSDEFRENENRIEELLQKYTKEDTETRQPGFRLTLVESDMDSTFRRSKRVSKIEKRRLTAEREGNEEDIQ